MRFSRFSMAFFLAGAISGGLGGAARADDQPFLTLDATDIEPESGHELEQNFVWLSGKSGQSFNAVEGESDLEYGYSD